MRHEASLPVKPQPVEWFTIAQVSTHWRIMGNPLGQREHTEMPVVVIEDGQAVKPPHTNPMSNMTEMEGSQPHDNILQLNKKCCNQVRVSGINMSRIDRDR